MMYPFPVDELIRRRRSVRTYSSSPIDVDTKQKIIDYSSSLATPSAHFRFQLLEADSPSLAGGRIGTYGTILGARTFIASICHTSRNDLIDIGFSFENLILFITSLGLGTCWLGGTFNRNKLLLSLQLESDEIVPAITPIGYPSTIRGPFDLIMKPFPSLKTRNPWSSMFFDFDFTTSLTKKDAGQYELPLEMLRFSPSASNRQPWRVVRRGKNFHFYLCHHPIYAFRYSFDMQLLDIGICMFHFEQTSIEQGLGGNWKTDDPQIQNKPPDFEYISSWITT